jgi:hypothetical protein
MCIAGTAGWGRTRICGAAPVRSAIVCGRCGVDLMQLLMAAPWGHVGGQPLVLRAEGLLWPYCHVHVPANRHGNAHEVPACGGLRPNRQICSVWRAHQQGTTGGSTVILPIGCGFT